MERKFGLTELIKEALEKEIKDPEVKELALKILEAYLKDGKRAVEELIQKLFEEAVKYDEELNP
ncbi:MAG: hypothetical protein DRJ63_09450 [Thermoprotei archaeon]|nr:MAG: hypothetical protein DRJ63_09450 [Thermoprotei archaeon]